MSISSDSDTKWTPLMFPCVVWWCPRWPIGSSQLCCTFSVWQCECAPSWCSLNSGIGMLHIFLTGVCSETLSNSKTILCPLNMLVVFFTSSVCTSRCLQLHTPRSIGAHYCRNDLVLVCPSCESDLQMHTFSCILSWADHGTHFFMAGVHLIHVCISDDTWVSAFWKRAFFFTCVFQGVAFVIFRMIHLSVHTVLQFDAFPDKWHSLLRVWLLSQQSCSPSWQHVLTASAHTYHGSPPQKKIDTSLAL